MSSLRRQISARANGARSRGPKTPEGKKRVSQNAIRHGLFGPGRCREQRIGGRLPRNPEPHLTLFRPADAVEYSVVEELVSAYWRRRRAWLVEHEWAQKNMSKSDEEKEPARIGAAHDA